MIREILALIVKDVGLEARWLNTLSLLEHIGARKIMKSMGDGHPDSYVLDHVCDEARHAAIFKRLSDSLMPGAVESRYLCRDEAVTYFQLLDKAIGEWIQDRTGHEDPILSYWLVTTLVERRAMRLYPLYRSLTQQFEVQEELKNIILEEAGHKPGIEERALVSVAEYGLKDLDELEALEHRLFHFFERSLQRTLSGRTKAQIAV